MFDLDRLVFNVNENFISNHLESIHKIIQENNTHDVAYILSNANEDYFDTLIGIVIETKENELDDILPELSDHILNKFIQYCHDKNLIPLIRKIFSEIYNDDTANIISVIDPHLSGWLASTMDQVDYDDMIPLMQYPEETSGRVMNTDFIAVNEDFTVGEALKLIKKHGEDAVTINSIYIVDNHGVLKGVVSLRKLIFQSSSTPISQIMRPDVLSVNVHTDQEKTARKVEHYNLSSIPVIDDDGVIRGIITVDDVIDIIRAETTEDIMKLAGSESKDLYETSSWSSFKRRAPWLLVAFIGGMITVKVMYILTNIIPHAAFLAFVPVIVGMSGNVANQSSTILVRGLATGKIHVSKLWQMLMREVVTSLMLGLLFGTLLFFTSQIEFQGIAYLSASVSIAIILSMMIAAFFATILPILFTHISIDPAVATGPFVTVSIDILGTIVYLATIIIVTGFTESL